MRILLSIHHHLDQNAGAPGAVMALAKEFHKQGHQVEIYSFDKLPGYIPDKLRPLAYPYYLAWHISKKAREGQSFDVVDASTGDAWVWGIFNPLKSRLRTILVTHSHGLEHTAHQARIQEYKAGLLKLSWKYPIYHGGFRLREVAISLKVADSMSFLNNKESQFAIQSLCLSASRASVIPNGIDERFLKLPITFELVKTDSIGIAQVGSYISRKGIQYGAQALNHLLEKYPKIRVGFFGAGCTKEHVLASFQPQFHSRIHVVPYYNKVDLPALLHDYHIKLFPTLSEGFSLALGESMACGLAPIATDIAGAGDIIRDGDNGFLIPPRDSNAIISGLSKLIDDENLLLKLRQNAYESVQSFTWGHIASTKLNVYERVKSSKKAGAGDE